MKTWLSQFKNRAYVYSILVAAGPLLIGAGLVADGSWDHWLDLAGAALMIGGGSLALANPTPDDDAT